VTSRTKTTVHFDGRCLASAGIGIVGMVQFTVSLAAVIEMNESFRFGREFLSHLGQSTSHGSSLFNRSLIVLGICLIVFFIGGYLLRAGVSVAECVFGVSGILSSAGLIGIGVTPLDIYYILHHVFLVTWLIPMAAMVAAGYVALEVRGVSRILFVVFSGALFLGIGLYLLNAIDEQAPAFQAIVLFTATIWFLVTSFHLISTTFWQITVVRRGYDRKTRQYLQTLEQTGLYQPGGRSSGRWEP